MLNLIELKDYNHKVQFIDSIKQKDSNDIINNYINKNLLIRLGYK